MKRIIAPALAVVLSAFSFFAAPAAAQQKITCHFQEIPSSKDGTTYYREVRFKISKVQCKKIAMLLEKIKQESQRLVTAANLSTEVGDYRLTLEDAKPNKGPTEELLYLLKEDKELFIGILLFEGGGVYGTTDANSVSQITNSLQELLSLLQKRQ
jgi:hypothetical protein